MSRLAHAAGRAKEWLQTHSGLFTALALFAILAGYAAAEAAYFTPAYLEDDPDGYLILAKRIARGGPLAVADDDIFRCQAHVWVENRQGRVIPKFAPGYPAVMALFYLVGGDEAMFLVSPVSGLLALLGAFFLFRLWMSRIAALLGCFFLAANKMFLFYTGYLLTHGLDSAAVVWGMYFIFKWLRDGRPRFAVATGLLIGFACAVRYANCLLFLVLLVAVVGRFVSLWREILRQRRAGAAGEAAAGAGGSIRPFLKSIAALLICGSIFPVLIGVYNWTQFGSVLTTGYALSNEQTAFSWKQFLRNYGPVFTGLGQEGLFPVFYAGLIAMLALGPWTEGLMRILWFLPLVMLHSSYYWAGGRMEVIRFFISTFPVFIGATFAMLDRLAGSTARKLVALAALLALTAGFRYGETKRALPVYLANPPARSLVAVGRSMATALKDDAVIFSGWPNANCLGTRRNYRYYDLENFTAERARELTKRGEVLQQDKRFYRLRDFYAKHPAEYLQELKCALVERFLADGRQVVFLLPLPSMLTELDQLGPDFEFTVLRQMERAPRGGTSSNQWSIFEVKVKR